MPKHLWMGLGALFCTLLAGLALDPFCGPEPAAPDAAARAALAPLPPGELVLRTLPGDPELSYYVRVPLAGGEGAPLLVAVHGISRNSAVHARAFAPLAERHAAVLLVPHFAASDFRDYQRLGRTWKGPRADRALERLVAHVGRATGALTDAILLFGYSGGAQFAHRYAMAHPERVAAAAVASAGWFTFPDPGRWYPYGTRATPELAGVAFDADAYLSVPMLVTVGEADVKRTKSLRRAGHVDRQQGRTRLERAQRWVEAMAEAAREHALPPAVELAVLGGMHHSFSENVERAGLAERVAEHLFAPESLARLQAPRATPTLLAAASHRLERGAAIEPAAFAAAY